MTPAQLHCYLLVLLGNLEPELRGPFDTDRDRLTAAVAHRRAHGDHDGLYRVNLWGSGRLDVEGFSGGEPEPDEEPDVNDEPPPDVGPPGSGAIITEYTGTEPGLEDT